ncbi:MAG: ABC transporter permease [Clostridiaceae bacterium]|nr:ABC transporter permease [Clostridiaceae bacterium]
MKALRMEFFKCRRRRLWLPLLVMLAAQLAWGLYSMRDPTARELQQGWATLLYNFPMLNAMMTPVIAAVVASRMADIEHKGQTLKLLETVQRTGTLFDAKFLCGAAYMALFELVQLVVMIAFGLFCGFAGAPPADKIAEYFAATLLTTLTILLLQLVLSLLIPNQMIGMIIGLIGSFVGLFSLFFPPSFQKFLLWAYYAVLYNTRMDWDAATRISDYYFIDFDWAGFACLIVYFLVIYAVGRILFVKKEV